MTDAAIVGLPAVLRTLIKVQRADKATRRKANRLASMPAAPFQQDAVQLGSELGLICWDGLFHIRATDAARPWLSKATAEQRQATTFKRAHAPMLTEDA
jgi:hypothetical protein